MSTKYTNFSNDRIQPNQEQTAIENKSNRRRRCKYVTWFGICIFVASFALISIALILQSSADSKETTKASLTLFSDSDDDNCQLQIVESIPDGLNYTADSPTFLSTYHAWQTLLNIANSTLDIGSFYWTLRGADVVNHSTAAPGEDIFRRLLENGQTHKLKIRIAQSAPTPREPDHDTEIFAKHFAADVRSVDFARLLGGGVLHTKLWLVDGKHFYLGSANMDWRALTQVKELGVLAQNCSALARDVAKVFSAYWYLGSGNTTAIPDRWPSEFETAYNWENPMIVAKQNTEGSTAFFSSSPPPLSPNGRTNDLDAILKTILSAKVYVNIAVMDYLPLLIYTKRIRYWPYIDDALRTAAIENKVAIKMLISWWPHSMPAEDYFLRSLVSLTSAFAADIQIRRFIVPSNEDQAKIPFGRVNHNKYMVTDNVAYIGTSNWAGDYFTDTAGIGLVLRELSSSSSTASRGVQTIRADLEKVFMRDWESQYAHELGK